MVTKYPLLRPAISMAAGILVASRFELNWQFGFGIAGTFALAATFSKAHRTLLGMSFWLFFGASLFSYRYAIRDPTDLREFLSGEPELATIAGSLSDDPERRVLEQDRRTRYRTTARVTVREIRRGVTWQQAYGEIAVSTTGFVDDDFVAGAEVQISGVIMHPQGPAAPGLFDFEQYLKWQRIFFVLRADTTNDWQLARARQGWSAASVYRAFNDWARHTLQRGIPYDENTRLLWAMVLGWKPGLTNEISEPFMRTGTLHVFAISGLHIAMIAAILVNVLRQFRLSRNWAGGIAIPIIWFYTGATGWQASAIRSTIMSSVIIFGWLLKRPNNLLNSLAASALLIFLWQPEQLFQTGFQLSFILLLSFAVWPGLSPNTPWPDPSIYLGYTEPEEFGRKPEPNAWTKFLARVFELLTGRDPMLPAELRPLWRRKLDPIIIWLLGALNVSLASLVGSLPVIANYFNLISLSSLFANLIIVPASGLALALSMGSLVLSWLPLLTEMTNWLSWGTMFFMVWFCRAIEKWHWTYEYVRAPGILVVVAYYFSLIALLKSRLRIAVAGLVVVFAIPLWREATETTVTMLPGSGVIFVDAPWSKNDLLIDCGRDREVATLVKPFLRSRGVDRLNAVVLTHGDVEHVEGYSRLVREFHPMITYTSAARSRSPKYREIVRELERTPEKWRVVSARDHINDWIVLHPARGVDFSRADDEAIVLRKEINRRTVALLSDLGRAGQQALENSSAELKSGIVFTGVPNDGLILRPELMSALQPNLIIIGSHDAKVQRAARELRGRATNVLTTVDERAITLTKERNDIAVTTMTGKRIEVR